ncbi:hypothetical protein QRX25_14820 [Bacillus sp. L381]|uniref:hypothetical protein n=1 Tax=Bacillus TaxID=1386 RepID=UPI001BAAB633|nr:MULTISPECIES: hypothetical protein [Bacillus]MCR9040824.1 hypothetical protein [Bacillus velezensis]QUN08754.1 hypothetical protein KEF49_14620 [Bacillus amyloliquefaciens]QYM81826.1 hypothetical protein KTJ85_14465 [Bacillus sp. 7D3]QZY10972.1 hypothetical protein K7B13_14720 [Bacillus amyloliquefaciens]WIX20873.1 hypothetical protein QRX25_14820 [Bacillus sp. L381]
MKHYYEFRENEYYALVVVSVEDNDLYTKPYVKATELYLECVGGESVTGILEEALPILITEELAFLRVAQDKGVYDISAGELLKEFRELNDVVLLIDGALQ